MKHISKKSTSKIITKSWTYEKNAAQIRMELEKEQDYFCAYTEERLSATYARDVEHFNPQLKDTTLDNYYNWYAVSHKWNNKKHTKWSEYQPCTNPSDPTVESQYNYENGYYDYDPANKEAANLDDLIGLNNFELVKERQAYIAMLEDLQSKGIDLKEHLKKHECNVRFRRAIETTFGFKP